MEINHHYINEIDFPLILLTAGVENSDILILDHDSFELFLTSGLAVPISSKILEKISIDDEYNFYFKDEKPLAIKIYESMNSSTNIHTNFSWLDFKCDEKDRTFYLVINQNSAFYKKDDLDVILEAITYLLK